LPAMNLYLQVLEMIQKSMHLAKLNAESALHVYYSRNIWKI